MPNSERLRTALADRGRAVLHAPPGAGKTTVVPLVLSLVIVGVNQASDVAHSGRVVFAAAGVMVAVFLTFALSGPIPPKEMGVVLGVAVLLDAFLVRLVLLPATATQILAGLRVSMGVAVVLMVPTTQPEDIASYANRVGNAWKIGLPFADAKGAGAIGTDFRHAGHGAIHYA